MRNKKSFQEQLNDMRNKEKWVSEEEFTEEVAPSEEPEVEEEKLYTLNELKENLLDAQGLKDVVADFPVSKDLYEPNKLYICTIPKGYQSTEVQPGQYIGVSTGLLSESEDFSHLRGQMPRNLYETSHVLKPLIRINNTNIEYQQHELLEDIKDDKKIYDVELEDLRLATGEEVSHLEIVDNKFFESRINEVLDRYTELTDSDDLLKYYSKLRELVGSDKMIYCSLLDKCVKIID
ncbi:hypothetical protein F867_gp177 [Staphylococcus phage JD007]|uniref:Uncharacterized protein n=1 Tax=Staphylococcus phage JD007 TaxID=1239383 RepID=K7QN62_9CAUD|nr:hypothetical protein F867_gp177 [Staphylococcus phage JD007]AFV50857.1 hypothetical protein [Staphylococcus phage JD007]VEV88745.1 hypothetical protein [Staphylococcus phage Stab21]